LRLLLYEFFFTAQITKIQTFNFSLQINFYNSKIYYSKISSTNFCYLKLTFSSKFFPTKKNLRIKNSKSIMHLILSIQNHTSNNNSKICDLFKQKTAAQ
jgi:hypothetical protein